MAWKSPVNAIPRAVQMFSPEAYTYARDHRYSAWSASADIVSARNGRAMAAHREST